MKKLTVFILLLATIISVKAQNSGEITGKVVDYSSQETLPDAHMILYNNGIKVSEVSTNNDGIYVFKPLNPGTYDVSILYIGYDTTRFTGIIVKPNGFSYQTFEMKQGLILGPVVINPSLVDDQVPGIIQEYKAEDIGHMAVSSAIEVAMQAPAVLADERTGGLFLGGSREDATLYVVDGVRVVGSLYVPMNAILSISVITGGIPANYGDFTGGIIEITTKGYSGIF